MIPFNKPYLTGKEAHYMYQAVSSGKLSGNGIFTRKCQQLLEERYGFKKTLLTTSCTDALEMAAILIDTQPGDEIIMPSYTFVSTANPFILRGAKIVFADSEKDTPNLDADTIESLITPKTKAIVPVHYAGVACDMKKIMDIANKNQLWVIEDAAQAIDSYFENVSLGAVGHLSAFSFHETKNIIAGEGGMLAINDERFVQRAEIIWEKGTNRAAFFRGEIDKYGWVDIGSSFLPSEVVAAFLYAQLENIDNIQQRRQEIWNLYQKELQELNNQVRLPFLPEYATNNAHIFYLICKNVEERQELIAYLKDNGVHAVFHYLSLHKSPFYKDKHDGRELPLADFYSDTLVRLPLFKELTNEQVLHITHTIKQFYKGAS
ncbi:dTDP-4-amino-4,6-dideoxygalactose transaminase [Chitinophaga silvatica]|uniref:dTDP-4-amino-4,6-dideoxygalactose transaminase n=1 Tax=Chitinophaga silvatica TaxID=2282649 RepID=A0A3E1Y211_9BACT|nr:dTDP-4-amino-4,6-dideoxygalactose transaminase [Chitinophaga silvatica]RFS18730.1 dTDP-4-amino-4,6-dideoxygalactose transaminase [Chitinophaga silvatica]